MPYRALIRCVPLTAAALALAGCAGARGPADEAARRTSPPASDCFTVSLARDFRYLDDHNLVVFAAGRTPYHVELSQACFGLRGEAAIGLRSRTDRMCGFAGDAVIVRGVGFPERCPVLSVRRLDDDQLRILLDQFGAGGREDSPIEVEVVELPEDEPDEGEAGNGEGGAGNGEGTPPE